MSTLSDNRQCIKDDFKKQGANMSSGVRDFAGWVIVIAFLLTLGAWRFGWIQNLVTDILSIIILAGVITLFCGNLIASIIHRR